MTALEIRPEEIGRFDLEAYRALKRRISGQQYRPVVTPARIRLAMHRYITPIGPERVRDWLYVNAESDAFRVKRIVAETMEKRGISKLDFFSKRRLKPIANCRHEACYRLRHETSLSLPAIARAVGLADHTSARHAIIKWGRLLEAGKVSP